MGRKMKVCVVDDDIGATTVLCDGLRLNGYEAVGVYSGADALKVCAEGGIDLVLLDILMPVMDGYEVFENLNSNEATTHIPVIFVSAKDGEADVQKGLRLGAVEYITKPYNLPMVMVRVEAALNANGARAEGGGPELA
ncbi:MAG: response regulator, partial [Candidatus Hydrogenedentes bacterium]|nr:response regulator [Candidatus Hydrogenedentota bacterium]